MIAPASRNCPICNHYLVVSDFKGDKEPEYFRCTNCGVLRTRYNYDSCIYEAQYCTIYLGYAQTPVNLPLNLFRLGLVGRWLRKESKILDVGCCIGEFIRFAEKYYFCVGFEPNDAAVEIARDRIHSRVVRMLPPDNEIKFDCITMFDVIEHIQEPGALLNYLYKLLNPRGIIAITTPNVEAVSFNGKGELEAWKHWKPREHLWLHTKRSLTRLLNSEQFDVIHVGHEESLIRPGNSLSLDLLTMVGRKG